VTGCRRFEKLPSRIDYFTSIGPTSRPARSEARGSLPASSIAPSHLLIYLLEKALFETKGDVKHSWVSIETNDVTYVVAQAGTTPATLDVLVDRTPKNRFDVIIEIVRNLAPDKVALQFHIRTHSTKNIRIHLASNYPKASGNARTDRGLRATQVQS